MEEFLKNLLYEYQNFAYLIIFLWCIAEGELALILGGIVAQEGQVDLGLRIGVAGVGGGVGQKWKHKFIYCKVSV